MKFVQLLYNPMAGNRDFPNHLDAFIHKFESIGCEVRIHRTVSNKDFEHYLIDKDLRRCTAIIAAGGDGSVNRVVNFMMKQKIEIPLGVIPSGTANDFATYMNIPMDYLECFDVLSEMQEKRVDVGQVNDRYFINVCSGGLFTNISQNIDIELKNTLGKLAYYIKGVQQIPRFRKIRYLLQSEKDELEDDFYLFLLLNSTGAGSFNKLAAEAAIDDGYMDLIGIKACPINELPFLFSKILRGDHLRDRNVIHWKVKELQIHCLDESEQSNLSDIDGEAGPKYPLNITVKHKALSVISKKES